MDRPNPQIWNRHVIVFVLLFLSVCTQTGETPDHEFSIINVEGVPTSITKNAPKYTRDLFEYELIGQLELPTDEDKTLDNVFLCVNDSKGNIFIADMRNLRISVFNSSGQFQYIIGGDGEGPGEFRSINGTAVLGDKLVVSDRALLRTSIFNLDGTFIESISFPSVITQLPLSIMTYQAFPIDDVIVLIQQAFHRGSFPPDYFFRSCVVTTEGEELALIEAPFMGAIGPYRATPKVNFVPGHGIVWDNGTEGIVKLYNERGQLNRIIQLELDRVTITREERDEVLKSERDRIEEEMNLEFRQAIQNRLDSYGWPSQKAYWRLFQLDEFGFGWAQHPVDVFEGTAWSTPYRVFSPEGEYLGDTELPHPPTSKGKLFISYGRIICSYIDEDSFETVVEMYQIKSAIDGFSYPD